MEKDYGKTQTTDNSLKYLSVKTRGEQNPSGKRKVYFTCHPKDFKVYFDKVCEDIFKTQDCAIYYTEDMTAPLPEEYLESDLGQMSLFVMPVTFRLLYEKNRAMDFDFAFATSEKHMIPVLPLMMEPGIDEFYEKRFGKREYYSPYGFDKTAISYEDKLKKYLSSVLLDDDTVERIRKAFDAYIFLSYRKKDRNHANELMGLIHKNPMYRDVAIWYDEFLTPGEDFEKDIKKALDKSELFTLLVTPNLINEGNYVQAMEYPYARDKAKKRILPAEMVETDKEELKKQYPGVPDCINAHTENLDAAILDGLKTISLRANEDDPEHCYLIGLAYLDGVDVEVNKEYAIELITSAAEKDYPEAMEKLYYMYRDGDSIQLNYNEALKWAQRLYDHYFKIEGEMGERTLKWLNYLAITCLDSGNYKKALGLLRKSYELCQNKFGERDLCTLRSLNNLANAYRKVGDYPKAIKQQKKCYKLHCEIMGEDSPMTLCSLNVLACIYGELGDRLKALNLQEKCYELRCKFLGDEHSDTLHSLSNLAVTYSQLGDYKKALMLKKKCYKQQKKVLGKNHPDTLTTLNNLAFEYGRLGDNQKAKELHEECYERQKNVLGEEHPDTLITLCNLTVYNDWGAMKQEKSIECYESCCKVFGKEHPITISALNNLAVVYGALGNTQKALELFEKTYTLQCKVLGEEHPDTFFLLFSMANIHNDLGNNTKALELSEKCYNLCCKVLGEEHPDTLCSLNNLANVYDNIGDNTKALELSEECYNLRRKVLGKEHSDTLNSMCTMALIYAKMKKYEKAEEIYANLYIIYSKIAKESSIKGQSILCDLLMVSYLSKDYEIVANLCKTVYNADYALIPELAEIVARIYDDNQMPDKAAVVRAKEKLQTE